MYHKIDENHVKSDLGFEVFVRIGNCLIEYYENDRLFEINIECRENPFRIAVYSGSIEQWDPPHTISVSLLEAKRILSNVIGALDTMGGPYEII